MSPDERAVVEAIAAAARRARGLAIAEALAWGLAAAAASWIAAPLAAALVLAWRLPATRRSAVIRAVERTHPKSRNLFVTADELSSGQLAAKPETRQRVLARAAAESRTIDRRTVAPVRGLVRAAAVAAAAWLVVSSASLWRPMAQLARHSLSPGTSTAAAGSSALHATIALSPPSYTGLPASSLVDPSQLAAVEGTVASVQIDGRAARLTVERDGITKTLVPDGQGRFLDRLELRKTGYYAIEADTGGRRVIPIVVTPDALPTVRVTAPGRDLVYAAGDGTVAFEVSAADDFGLRALALEYTRVSGSGEQFEFQDGQIPLTLAKSGDRDWRGGATQSLASFRLEEGDMLVYRAVAADARPGDGAARSDAFFIEISKLAVAAGDAFTVPEEETRYALSQQMLIVKTERLERRRAAMAGDELNDAALNLAVEQRMIRAELVFMLGGEIEDEEIEAEQSSELQAGRLVNRGQRDLRAATVAMSQAEKLLTGGNTREAVTAERAAVAALQRAFARDRYILRALGSRTQLDPARRLTGSLADAANWRRDRPAAPQNRRAALLQDLLVGIGELGRGLPVQPSAAGAARAIALAREALRIDAGSPVLQKTAADLQRLADTWSSTSAGARRAARDALASAVAAETARTLAEPPLPSPFASALLAGAFADALRTGGAK